ncbi:hypothetical protein EJB05_50394, partial [Eragrostis curvula]
MALPWYSPCLQLALLGVLDLVFLAASLVRRAGAGSEDAAAPEHEALLRKPSPPYRYAVRRAAALGASAVFAATSVVLLALALALLPATPWRDVECAFLAVHAVTHGAAAWTVAASVECPVHLRSFWVASALVAALSSASAGLRWADDALLLPNDFLAFAGLLVSLPLVYAAVSGSRGVAEEGEPAERSATPYATASFLSRATFSWIYPLISKGHAAGSLTTEDVPAVCPDHRAEASYARFMSNWPAQGSRHPVAVALWLSFWPQLVVTAVLGLLRLGAMYVGPSLIQKFVEFIRHGGTPWEGLRLVLTLVVGTVVQTLASHHRSFQAKQLRMRIRGSLQTALYRKSLRLSPGARRAHGTGAIMSYMHMDAGSSGQCHGRAPRTIVVALLLLYSYLGAAVLTTLAVMAAASAITALASKLNVSYQLKFVGPHQGPHRDAQPHERHQASGLGGHLRRQVIFGCANNVVFSSGPLAMTVLVFATYLASGGELDAGKVFTATAFFGMLQGPMHSFPSTIISSLKAYVSLGRLNKFLMDAEIDSAAVERIESGDAGLDTMAVKVQGGEFAWDGGPGDDAAANGHGVEENGRGDEPETETTVLKGINMEIRRGELAAVVGTVGSGKSSLLSCIMGEMHKVSGKVSICGSTAFVAQTAWIRNGTIQENILFGKPMHPERYSEVIRACCLEKDLEMLDFGDQTEIGERGINLSGGQKQRIQLARAVYQDCDIYLLDDIFSAVDAHTGSTIFTECLKGMLKNKTVLLVTHQIDFLQNVDAVFVMKDGRVIQSGIYHDLLASCPDLSALVAAHHSSLEVTGEQGLNTGNCQVTTGLISKSSSQNGEMTNVASSKEAACSSKLIQEEEKESGRVSWHVYKLYITETWGLWGFLTILAMTLLSVGFSMASDYWLTYETSGGPVLDATIFLGVYVLIVAVTIVFKVIITLFTTFLGLRSAQTFFNKMFQSIVRAPMSFFETTPSGRIISRASSDQDTIDSRVVFYIGYFASLCISVISRIVVTCQVAWPSIIAVLPLLLLNFWYRNRYIVTSRELTRLQGVTRAPVIDHFTETFSGAPTIRCFRKEHEFYQTNLDRINSSLRMSFHDYVSTCWFRIRLELIGTLMLSITAFFMISLPSNFIKKEFVGMSLSYGLTLNHLIYATVTTTCDLENDMIAVERVNQYSNLPSEAAWEVADRLPSPNWPSQGDIDIKDLKVRYRANTPLILKGMTVRIRSGEKIGVVGRTGSGKTTLVRALFRLVEPAEGQIIIDGVDICTLGLHDLRSRFGVIPQEPVLFEGTVRSNIDPTGRYSDDEIWQALERCQLKDIGPAGKFADNGENWSVGQKQLLCFGRVMLKRSRILFMDEATASVDSQTDAAIQRIIREEFVDCTVISIAHRIPTVMDSDRVLVLDEGLVKEFDAPAKLMGRPSLFGTMVQEYATRSSTTQPSHG